MYIILSWNANGLSSHKDELLLYLSINKFIPNIICIQETHFNNTIYIDIPGFTLIKKDRLTKKGGGVCIYIQSNIAFDLIHIDGNLEVVGINIYDYLTKKLISINCVYLPPLIKIELATLSNIFTQDDTIS